MRKLLLLIGLFLALYLPISFAMTATGGTTYVDGGSTVHVFRSNGTFTVTDGTGCNLSALVVGGGGGGGNAIGGGGGAGGLNFTASYTCTAQAYTVVVGNGGYRANSGAHLTGFNGQNSSFDAILGWGGGGGGFNNNAGLAGGSGGGGGYDKAGGAGVTGLGNAGGAGGAGGTNYPGGGGGGAGSVGQAGTMEIGGSGGGGRNLTINGSLFCYAGGGGGGTLDGLTLGSGSCGGGNGGMNNHGLNGTGSGGGGSDQNQNDVAGHGGNGIVILRYANSVTSGPNLTITATDLYDGSAINNYSVRLNGVSGAWNQTTNNGTILIINATYGLYTLTFSSYANGGYFESNYSSVNVQGQSFVGRMYQVEVIINASEIITGTPILNFGVAVPLQYNQSRSSQTTSSISEVLVSSSFENQGCATGNYGLNPAIDEDWFTYTNGGTVYENYTRPNDLVSANFIFKGESLEEAVCGSTLSYDVSCFDGSSFVSIFSLNSSTAGGLNTSINKSIAIPTNCLQSPIRIKTYAPRIGAACTGGISFCTSESKYYEGAINYTVQGNGLVRLLLKAGKYNITGNTTGYINATNETTFLPYTSNRMTLNFGTNIIKIAAKDIFSNATINSFNVSLTGINVSYNSYGSTTNGNISFLVLNGIYNATFTSTNYAVKSQTITVDTQLQNNTMFVYPINSIYIRIYDLATNALILTPNSSVRADFSSAVSVFNLSTKNGTIFAEMVTPSTYDILISSSGYTSRDYFVTLNGGSNIELNAYLSNSTITTTKTFTINDERTSDPISGVLVSVSQRINITYVTIAQDNTDISGQVAFDLVSTQEYRFTLSAGGYETRTFDLTPSSSAYTLFLTPEATVDFTTIYDLVDFVTYPINGIITTLGNINFSIITASISGTSINHFGVYTTLNSSYYISNISGSPGGGTAYFTFNMSNLNSTSFNVYYFIDIDGELPFLLNRTFYYNPSSNAGNNSATAAFDDLRDNIPFLVQGIIAVVVILIAVVSFRSAGATGRGMNFVAGGVAGLLGWLGFIPMRLAIIMMILLFATFFIFKREES